jgi:hypothetical protein
VVGGTEGRGQVNKQSKLKVTAGSVAGERVSGALWLPSRRALWFVLVGVLCVGAVLRLMDVGSSAKSPDEWNYARQARLIRNLGHEAFPVMIAEFRGDNSLPPPTRAGFLYLLTGVMRVTGRTDEMAGTWVSCVASLASLLLLARIGWRFFGPVVAVIAVTFYASSALPLMTSHKGWQDATVEMLTLGLMLAAAEIMSGARIWLWSLAFTLTGAVCLTMKEVPAAVFLLLSVCVVWSLLHRQSGRRPLEIFLGLWVGSVAVALGWLTYLLGDARLLLEYPHLTAVFLAGSEYSRTFESGTAINLLHGFWIISPLALVCFPLGLVALAGPLDRLAGAMVNRTIAIGFAGVALFFAGAAVVTPHHLNFRYICPAFGPLYLVAGLGCWWVAEGIATRLRRTEQPVFLAGVALVVLVSGVSDYTIFQQRFLAPKLTDLSIKMILSNGR